MEKGTSPAMSADEIRKQVRLLFDREITVVTPAGEVHGICQGTDAAYAGGKWFWKRYRLTHVLVATLSFGDGGGFGSRVPADQILSIGPRRPQASEV